MFAISVLMNDVFWTAEGIKYRKFVYNLTNVSS